MLRRRLPCHDSSSSCTGDLTDTWRVREGPAGLSESACCCWILTVSNEETEGRRDRRILGRRVRFEGARGRDVAGAGREDDASAGCDWSGILPGAVEPSAGSIGSMAYGREGGTLGRLGKAGIWNQIKTWSNCDEQFGYTVDDEPSPLRPLRKIERRPRD